MKLNICLHLLIFPLFVFSQHTIPQRLSDSINTLSDEYWVSLTADDSTLIFNRLLGDDFLKNEDLFTSTKNSNGEWSKATPLSALNTEDNEGAQSLSANGRFMVFTACNRKDSYGSCDLYYSIKIGDKWLPARNMGEKINTRFWETQPSLSADGSELYFVSNRSDGAGKMDIWYSKLLGIDENAQLLWSTPQNLSSINTANDELAPFIHNDYQTLYFSSNGYEGLGGLDIFITRKANGTFSAPINLKSPINTADDEMGFVVNAAGTTAYFSSDRNSTNKDIFSINIPTEIQPHKILYIKGKITDKTNNKPLFAQIKLQNVNDSIESYETLSDWQNGEYLLCIANKKQWRLSVEAKGYLFFSDNLKLKENSNNFHHQKNVKLSPIQKGEKIILKNVFFDTDKAILKPESVQELEHIKNFLQENPTLFVELGGHTDSSGSAIHNRKLSKERAFAVFKWLQMHGIAASRLSYRGYGDTIPIASNTTTKGKAINRRTELKVISD